jgi:hypothetical protein
MLLGDTDVAELLIIVHVLSQTVCFGMYRMTLFPPTMKSVLFRSFTVEVKLPLCLKIHEGI